jgi:hypothetical protein
MAVPIMAIAMLASAAYTAYNAEKQKAVAQDLAEKNKRPEKKVSQGYMDMVNAARTQAGKYGYAGMAQDMARLDRSTASSMRSIREGAMSPSSMMQAFAGVDYNTKMAQERMGAQAAQAKDRATGIYFNALQTLGQKQDEVWDYNEKQKYQENAAAISALNEASASNWNTAINTGLGAVTNAYGFYQNNPGGGSNKTGGGTADGVGDIGTRQQENYAYSPVNMNLNASTMAPSSYYQQQGQYQPAQNRVNDVYDMERARQQATSIYGPMSDQQIQKYLLGVG